MNKHLIGLKVLLIILIVAGCKASAPSSKKKEDLNVEQSSNYELEDDAFLNSPADPISIEWVENINDDFEFTKQWSYKEGVYLNSFGQVSCDGFCPERTDQMKDSYGRVLKDSLTVFYQLVDTTHIFHTLKSTNDNEDKSYVNYITASKVNDSTFTLQTTQNSHIYGGLKILLIHSNCYSEIVVISPNPAIGTQYYKLIKGHISIELPTFNKGIIKSKFDLTFELDSHEFVNWQGLVSVPFE